MFLALIALALAVPLLGRPQPASAQGTCNGSSTLFNTACSATNVSNCNGTAYNYGGSCASVAGATCTDGTVAYPAQACPMAPVATNAYAPQGFSVSYAAGWNIVAGPTGSTITGNSGPLYSFQPGDTAYQVDPAGSPLTGGAGAWAYFNSGTTTTIGLVNAGSVSVQLPAGQYVMIGNAGDTPATVSGADSVLIYSPSSGNYVQTTQLAAGQGAWAISMRGGLATLFNSPV